MYQLLIYAFINASDYSANVSNYPSLLQASITDVVAANFVVGAFIQAF